MLAAGGICAAQMPTMQAAGQASITAITRPSGTSSARRAGDRTDDLALRVTGRLETAHEQTVQLGIGQIQELGECAALGGCRLRPTLGQVPLEQEVQLSHSAPASPLQASHVLGSACGDQGHSLRSASIVLMDAIAFAGFRSFGQASVQAMIVWQRYSLNGSSRSSSRSPRASSRLSMIQR